LNGFRSGFRHQRPDCLQNLLGGLRIVVNEIPDLLNFTDIGDTLPHFDHKVQAEESFCFILKGKNEILSYIILNIYIQPICLSKVLNMKRGCDVMSGRDLVQLLEADVLPEALAAHVRTVLADEALSFVASPASE